ncbi:OsmC family protein [Arenibacter certesii]|uniref:Stress-induced protein OsmC n=1 Tax=Arenibacter certesii TaxID=228955 RepID=A0A918IW93_9FLAO|nr:OsmC family protein [Arenibacter certesii]GGW33397.1 stress-induced protein OsmC [Arenibacter certesii]
MTSKVTYLGDLRTSCEHLLSGNSFVTDAPLDNHGLGQAFSPTDTIATGLASCMFSVMGIKARSLDVNLVESTAEVTKFMEADPRRIVRIDVNFKLPKAISDKNRKILENTARTCPVHYSLHPDIVRNISFHWEL